MKASEAIEILEKEEEDTFVGSEKDWKKAVKLGYEALKHINDFRLTENGKPIYLLPGETEE